MKKKINLIISSFSLFVTAALLIVCMYAWYIVNETAQVYNIIAATEGVKGSFDFYYWNDTSTKNPTTGEITESGNWVHSKNDLKIRDAWPDDVFYFKIVGTNLEAGQSLKITFSGIGSSINTEYVTGIKNGENYEVQYSGVTRYTSSTTDVSVTYDSNSKILYSLTQKLDSNDTPIANQYDVGLNEILIQDVFKVYTTPTFKTVGDITDFPASKGSTSVPISGVIYDDTITSEDNNTKTIYFALSFDSLGDELDNYYQFQSLNIKNVQISLG